MPATEATEDKPRRKRKLGDDSDLMQPDGWRVKLYRLNADGSWDDCGTGRIVCLYRAPSQRVVSKTDSSDAWLYHETGEATLCVQSEVTKEGEQAKVLLRTRILLRDPYQRQGDNIITWCEPFYVSRNSGGVDLALSFQDNSGCLDIWRQITHVQSRASELLRQRNQSTAAEVASQYHAQLQEQDDSIWNGEADLEAGFQNAPMPSLPHPPTLQNLEEIADTIAALQHVQQREHLAIWIAQNDCSYFKALLALFPAAEQRGDYSKLGTLAACVKTILLLNEASILEMIVTTPQVFDDVCSCLEHDPDLREKANHRWFLRERAKFRTVVPMDNPELVAAIHRSFRVTYLRDTLLRPTMDEGCLTTLSNLQVFIHTDVVKGVTMSMKDDSSSPIEDSYLVRVIRLLGRELHELAHLCWNDESLAARRSSHSFTDSSTVVEQESTDGTKWKQYLAPQDGSLDSRKYRIRGCISFLRELFDMVRQSLHQSDRDDFFAVICSLAVGLSGEQKTNSISSDLEVDGVVNGGETRVGSSEKEATIKFPPPASPITLLSLYAKILADPLTDVSDKAFVLEIVAAIAMHDPGLIQRHCLYCHEQRSGGNKDSGPPIPRPSPNSKKQVLVLCPSGDLVGSLVYLLGTESDAGILLQVSEILRIVLESDLAMDHGPMNAFADEAEPPPVHGPPHDVHAQPPSTASNNSEQKHFLSVFYEHYMEWIVAPFQFTLIHSTRLIPDGVLENPSASPRMVRLQKEFEDGAPFALCEQVPRCSTRSSFAIELIGFCVRPHMHRMKSFLLRSRVLGNILRLLAPPVFIYESTSDRCLKLAALRLLRSILSVNDEFYHRHIVQHNLFAPVFEALRTNPIGDNLVSSAIVEMCDFIQREKIKSLLEYIVMKHLMPSEKTSLEAVAGPYVSTLTTLREAYEKIEEGAPGGAEARPELTGEALEDQRKFQETDAEESYFETDG